MLQYERVLPTFGTLSANATFSILLPIGPTYRAIVLEPTIAGVAATVAEMRTQISMVRLRINGTARYELPATTLLDINTWMGYTATAGLLPICLTYDWLRTVPAFENLAWGTRNVDSFTLEVTLAAGATINACTATALIVPEARDLGMIVEAHQFTFAAAGAGTLEISTLPKGNGDLVSVHFATSVASKAELKLNGVSFRDGSNAVSNHLALTYGERTAVANYVHYDPTSYGLLLDDRIPLGAFVQDFRFILTTSGAGTVTANMLTLNQPLRQLAA